MMATEVVEAGVVVVVVVLVALPLSGAWQGPVVVAARGAGARPAVGSAHSDAVSVGRGRLAERRDRTGRRAEQILSTRVRFPVERCG